MKIQKSGCAPSVSGSIIVRFGRRMLIALGSATVFWSVPVDAQVAPPRQYCLTDLGLLPSDASSTAYAVNRYGQVVGYSAKFNGATSTTEYQPFIWQPDHPNDCVGSMHPIGTFGGANGAATDINDMGQVSGYSDDAAGDSQMFLWNPSAPNSASGTMHALGAVGFSGYWTTGINNSGSVTGILGGAPTPVLWTPTSPNATSGGVSVLPYTGYGSGRAINDLGSITGHMEGYSGTYQAVRWTPGAGGYTYRNVGDDAGSSFFGPGAGAGINDAGTVVGSYTATVQPIAMLWDTSGATCPITAPGLIRSRGSGINSLGYAVGDYSVVENIDHAFLYEGGMTFDPSLWYDLNLGIDPGLGWVLLEAHGINDIGQICGAGVVNGQLRGYLLTPIPSPGAFGLALGAAVVACKRRRT